MYAQKIPKSQLPDKSQITTYYPHDTPVENRTWIQPYYRVISIDPGISNFAFRIETRTSQPNTSENYFHPKTEVLEKISFSHHVTDEKTGMCNLYIELIRFLDSFEQWYPTIHLVIIEKQLPINYKMVRLSQHVITYFHMKLKNMELLPSILEVDPKIKTQKLGAEKGLTKPEVKKWAIRKAYELLGIRSDDVAIGIINEAMKSKKDDLADTIVQIEAVFAYYNLPLTKIPLRLDIIMDTPTIPISNIRNISNVTNVANMSNDSQEKVESIILPTDPDELDNMSLRDIISNISRSTSSMSLSTMTPSPTFNDSSSSNTTPSNTIPSNTIPSNTPTTTTNVGISLVIVDP